MVLIIASRVTLARESPVFDLYKERKAVIVKIDATEFFPTSAFFSILECPKRKQMQTRMQLQTTRRNMHEEDAGALSSIGTN